MSKKLSKNENIIKIKRLKWLKIYYNNFLGTRKTFIYYGIIFSYLIYCYNVNKFYDWKKFIDQPHHLNSLSLFYSLYIRVCIGTIDYYLWNASNHFAFSGIYLKGLFGEFFWRVLS